LIAPATANTIAKFANGICESLLAAVYLSARCPVYIAPAMDLDMYRHQATDENINILREYGNKIINAEHGELASGLVGEGRMAEPEEIVSVMIDHFKDDQSLSGKKVLVTAGPTHEAIDPVRFIGNNSSGKMGFAIAEELAKKGAEVTIISGPTQQIAQHPNINVINIVSAEEMYKEARCVYDSSDIVVLAAAVADYKPEVIATEKIKKQSEFMEIKLTKTVDIAASLGKEKLNQFIVGFALETEHELANARKKIKKKHFDLIVLNSLKDEGAGFGFDTNKITIIDTKNEIKHFDLKAKKEVAQDIVNEIVNKINV